MMLYLDNFTRSWGSFSLKDISLVIEKGQYFILLGPCGSGKTLLLNGIAGIYRPDKGKIFMDGKDITHLQAQRRNIGYLFQRNLLFPHLSVKENIYYGLRYRKPDWHYMESIFELLDIRNLLLRKDTLNLSGGEAQKISLAQTLVIKPKFLLLDEPLASLDPSSQQSVSKILKSLNEKLGLTILHVTHDLQETMALSDSVALLIDGMVIRKGRLKDILNYSSDIRVRQYLGEKYEP